MEKLDKVLSGLIEVDYILECWLEIMSVLEVHASNEESREIENLLYLLNKNFGNLQKDLQSNIETLDKYIMANR
jgi:hypothetical protein